MPRRKNSKDVAPIIRGAFIRAVKALEDKGRPLSTVILECLEDNPLETLKAIKGFIPRESNIDLTTDGESLVGILSGIQSPRHDPEVEREPDTVRH